MRKTTEIATIVDHVNAMLADTYYTTPDMRLGAIVVLERILHDTGNYAGFRYLGNDELPVEVMPGVRYDANDILPYPERFENTDDSRRQYRAKCEK